MDGEGRLGGCEGSIWVVLGFPKTEGAKLEGAVVWGLLPPNLAVAGSSLGTGWHFLPGQVIAWLQDGLWALPPGMLGSQCSQLLVGPAKKCS